MLVALVIWGIDARIKTAAAVRQETLDLAIPTVSVIHPKPGSLKNEVVLPGNIQAFIDSPIYARDSGYLKKWYVDIGARVKAGQVLAEIDAPELDQQVRQAKAALQQVASRAGSGVGQSAAGQSQRGTRPRHRRPLEEPGGQGRGLAPGERSISGAIPGAGRQYRGARTRPIAAARSNIAAPPKPMSARLEEMQNYEIGQGALSMA